ncbi:sunset domain-containing protein [Lacticaseibacillus sp. GG6-2]
MATFFGLIFFVALLATGYFAVRFVIDRFTHHTQHHRGRKTLLALAVMIVALVAVAVSPSSTDLTPSQARNKLSQAQTTKHSLAAEMASAKQRQQTLNKQKALLLAEVANADADEKTATSRKQAAQSASASQASAQAASASQARVEAASQAAAQAKAASTRAAAASSQAASASQAASTATPPSAPTNNGDMNTGNTGKIVGNVNSKIYHVPGQAGYRMNSANAVYFNTEAQAQAAGYRKSLR